jgi:hypothetical protein
MNFTDILRYVNQAAAIAQPILGVANYFQGRSNLRRSERAARDQIEANRALAAEEARNLAADTERRAETLRKTALAQASARGTLDPRNINQRALSFGAADRFSRRELDIDLGRIARRQQIQNQNLDAQGRQVTADTSMAMNRLIGQSAGTVFDAFGNITGDKSPFKTITPPPAGSPAGTKPKIQYDIFGYKIR